MTSVVKKVTKSVSSLLGASGQPKIPPPPKPKVMPSPDDDAAKLARRRSMASQVKRGGRASTILTEKETLG